MRYVIGLLLSCCAPILCAASSYKDTDLVRLSLEELLVIELSVGTKTETKTLRETPGIVTVITAEEIANSGARDLIDVLRLVPGYSMGQDVYEITGPGVRGNWAYEGKVLLLLDGIELNERQYGNLVLGNHYPLDNIQRIEIIRGPGSVNYGGFAELGVINIITRTAEEIGGTKVSAAYGQMGGNWARQTVNLMHGQTFANGTALAASAYSGKTRRSDREYVSFSGVRQDMKESSHLDPLFLNIGLTHGNFSSRLLFDNYRTTHRNRYGEVEDLRWHTDFQSWAYQAKYLWAINEALKLNLEAAYYDEHAWREDMPDPELAVDYYIQRYLTKVGLTQRFSDSWKMAVGLELSWDESRDRSPIPETDLADFSNHTVYVESDYSSAWGNLILGARFDKHSIFGSNLAPRVAWTKVYDKFHYKLLYSHSFRAPAALNITYNERIRPEKAEVWEAEFGYRLSRDWVATVNLFDNKIEDTITYGVDPLSSEDTYFNATTTGTRGIEAELRWQRNSHYLILTHAYYESAHGTAENQRVINFQSGAENRKAVLGLPQHKTTLNGHARLNSQWSINPSLIWHGSAYAYVSLDDEDQPVLHKFSDQILFNLFVRYRPARVKNLELGLGVYDVFAQNAIFIQPFNGGSAPLPGPSREWLLKLSYAF
jgi:outer membrane cobalamin receptor